MKCTFTAEGRSILLPLQVNQPKIAPGVWTFVSEDLDALKRELEGIIYYLAVPDIQIYQNESAVRVVGGVHNLQLKCDSC